MLFQKKIEVELPMSSAADGGERGTEGNPGEPGNAFDNAKERVHAASWLASSP